MILDDQKSNQSLKYWQLEGLIRPDSPQSCITGQTPQGDLTKPEKGKNWGKIKSKSDVFLPHIWLTIDR